MSVPLHECGNCGRKHPAADMVYSRFTGARYCARNVLACLERGRKRRQAKGATNRV